MVFIVLFHPKHPIFNLVLLETNNICNRKCWFCKFGQPRDQEVKTRMKEEILYKLVADLKNINYSNRVSWVGINEPLLEKRLVEFVAYVKQHLPNCFQSTITNGDLLNTENYLALKKAGLNSLAISVYDTESMHKSLKLKGRHPEIVVWDKRNYSDQDWVLTKDCDDFTNRAGTLQILGQPPDMKKVPCQKPATGISVLSNGDVPLCCDDMYGDVIMGNVMVTSIDKIWYNQKFNQYRKALKNGRVGLKLCDTCINKGGPHDIEFP